MDERGGGKPVVGNRETIEDRKYRDSSAKRNAYVRFVIEREITRNQIPFSKAKDLYEYAIVRRAVPINTPNRDLVAYEEFLKNRALDNIYSPYKMFTDDRFSVAQVFNQIKRDFPALAGQFQVMEALVSDLDKTSRTGIRNLRLRNTKLKASQINVYKENLSDLSDPKVEKVPNKEANLFISRFFSMLPFYAYIQSGLNSSGKYSLNKIVPPEMFATYMIPFIREYSSYLDRPDSNLAFYELYYPAFVATETASGRSYRGGSRVKAYSTPFNLRYLDRLDARPADYVQKVAKEEIRVDVAVPGIYNKFVAVFADENGMYKFRPTFENVTTREQFMDYYSKIPPLVQKDPKGGENVFVHNKMVNPEWIGQMPGTGDWLMDHPRSAVPSRMGIPTVKYDNVNKKAVEFKDEVENGAVVPNKELKQQIDEAISRLIELCKKNRLIFNNNGYGLEFQTTAPVTYLYLSEQLAKNFGYANPGIKTNANAVAALEALEEYYQQPITYKEAAELYQKCLS